MARPKAGYKNSAGKKVVGVTTPISRFKDAAALMWWACEQGKAIERGEISRLYEKRDEAANAGTLAHEMVEVYIGKHQVRANLEALLSKHPQEIAEKATQGFENFLRWHENSRIEIIAQELSLVSEVYQYGGTLDAVGVDTDGRQCLLDWKTSSGGRVFVDYLIQLAAYKELWQETQNKWLDGGFHLCIFNKEHADFHHHYYSELNDAWEQFKLFLRAYKLDKKLKKRV